MIWFWQNRELMGYSLNKLYMAVGISKQGVHSMLGNIRLKMEMEAVLANLVLRIRKDHPTMSLRSLYHKIRPEGIGRDRFEAMCTAYGFKISPTKNYKRTTYSDGVKRFPNLLKGLEITGINQVWVSDITYYEVNERFYYITFIMDACSRYIKGYGASGSLRTAATTVPALKMALKKHRPPKGLIFHSDGGGQYYSNKFLELTKAYPVQNSMAKEAYENPQAERVNGTIKNCYLKYWAIKSHRALVKSVDRAVQLYNNEKPHKSLNYSTPKHMEENHYICNGQPVEGDGSRTAKGATSGASSPLGCGDNLSQDRIYIKQYDR